MKFPTMMIKIDYTLFYVRKYLIRMEMSSLLMKDLKTDDFYHLFTAEQGGNIYISYTALTRDLSFFGLNWNIDPFICLLRRYLPDSNLDPHGKVLEPKEILKYSPTKRPKTLKRHLFLFPKVTKSHRWRVDRHSFPKEILLNYKIHFSKTTKMFMVSTHYSENLELFLRG